MARQVRGQLIALKEQEFSMAALVIGASDARILFRHLLINAIGPIIVQITFLVPNAILPSLLKLHRNRHFRSDGKLGFHGTGCPAGAHDAPGTAAFADHLHLYHHFLPELPRRGNRRCL